MSIILPSLVKSGYFDDCITNENILLIGGAHLFIRTDENNDMYPITYMHKYCMENRAAHCEKVVLTTENNSELESGDYQGDFTDLEKVYAKESFDRVIVLSGLEMTDNPLVAFRQIYRLLKMGGKLNLILRNKNNLYVKYHISEYEHKWRITDDDVANIFYRDIITKSAKTTNDDFFIIEVKKTQSDNYISDNIPLFSCRAEKYIIPQLLSSLGYFRGYKDLENIGKYEITDKLRDHNYLNKYEFFLTQLRDKKFNFLELGIFKGGSAKMWEKYFHHAMIYCVDINPKCAQYETERIKPIIMDLGKENEVKKLRDINPEIVVDDASHYWDHQILALFILFETLPSGGIYILEDLETSVNCDIYPNFDNGCVIDTYTVLERICKVNTSKTPEPILDMFSEKINRIGLQIEMISFIKGSCIMVKR